MIMSSGSSKSNRELFRGVPWRFLKDGTLQQSTMHMMNAEKRTKDEGHRGQESSRRRKRLLSVYKLKQKNRQQREQTEQHLKGIAFEYMSASFVTSNVFDDSKALCRQQGEDVDNDVLRSYIDELDDEDREEVVESLKRIENMEESMIKWNKNSPSRTEMEAEPSPQQQQQNDIGSQDVENNLRSDRHHANEEDNATGYGKEVVTDSEEDEASSIKSVSGTPVPKSYRFRSTNRLSPHSSILDTHQIRSHDSISKTPFLGSKSIPDTEKLRKGDTFSSNTRRRSSRSSFRSFTSVYEKPEEVDEDPFDSITRGLKDMLEGHNFKADVTIPTYASLHPEFVIRETYDIPKELQVGSFNENTKLSRYRQRLSQDSSSLKQNIDLGLRKLRVKQYGRWYLSPPEYSVVGDLVSGSATLFDESSDEDRGELGHDGDSNNVKKNSRPLRHKALRRARRRGMNRIHHKIPGYSPLFNSTMSDSATGSMEMHPTNRDSRETTRILSNSITDGSMDKELRDIRRHAAENLKKLEDLNSARKFKEYIIRSDKSTPLWMQEIRMDPKAAMTNE